MDLLGHQAPPRARVLLDDSAGLELDYALPTQHSSQAASTPALEIGRRVRVPLRGRLRSGTITDLIPAAQGESPRGLKPIAELEAEEQSLTRACSNSLAGWLTTTSARCGPFWFVPVDVLEIETQGFPVNFYFGEASCVAISGIEIWL